MDLSEMPPGKVMIAGDWHGNTRWAVHAIREGCARLEDEEKKVILQLGDFGIWRQQGVMRHYGPDYLVAVDDALLEQDAWLFFLDGNHEDHKLLAETTARRPAGEAPVKIGDRLFHLPRGHRWTWHGRTWLALGGAASVDRAFRTEGVSWFREEEITLAQAAMAVLAGPADVMLTHECPRQVTRHLPLGHPMAGWDMEVSRRHQELLDRIIGELEPSFLFHGHMHLAHGGTFRYPHGDVQVTGLDMDGTPGNWGIYDVQLMAREDDHG